MNFQWLERAAERVGLDRTFFGNPAYIWLLGLAFFVLLFVVFYALSVVVERRARRRGETAQGDWPQLIEKLARATKAWFLLLLAAHLAAQSFDFPVRGAANLRMLTKIAFVIQSALWMNVALRFFTTRWMSARIKTDPGSVMLMSVMTFIGKAVLWTIVVLLLLENIGVQVTALVTGLGIGGVAVALAAQNILGDLFASLSIVVDKPFLLGDSIAVDNESGVVEQIGLKTTRIRALSGEQVVFPNANLLQSRIHNNTRQLERRVVMQFTIAADTPTAKITALQQWLKQQISGREKLRLDRVHLDALTDTGLKFEAVYFVTVPDYGLHMDLKHAIYLELLDYFAAEGIALPKPIVSPPPSGAFGPPPIAAPKK